MRLEGKSFRTIAHQLKEDGLRRANTKQQGIVSQSQIMTMLTNPFYHGVMRYNGKEYPHKYQPLITKRLFDKVQFLNDDRNNTATRHWHATPSRLVVLFAVLPVVVHIRHTKRKGVSTCVAQGQNQRPSTASNHQCQKANYATDWRYAQTAGNQRQYYSWSDWHTKNEHDNIQLYYKDAIKDTGNRIAVIEDGDTLYKTDLMDVLPTTDYDKYVKKAKAEKEELEYKLVEYTNNDKSLFWLPSIC